MPHPTYRLAGVEVAKPDTGERYEIVPGDGGPLTLVPTGAGGRAIEATLDGLRKQYERGEWYFPDPDHADAFRTAVDEAGLDMAGEADAVVRVSIDPVIRVRRNGDTVTIDVEDDGSVSFEAWGETSLTVARGIEAVVPKHMQQGTARVDNG